MNILQIVLQVTFTEEELPKGAGDFILGYYSNNMSTIVGVTEPFQVIANRLYDFSLSAFLGLKIPTHSPRRLASADPAPHIRQ